MRRVKSELLLERYQILARLGGGGFSEVFKAFDTRMGRMVAMKKIPASQRTAPRALREAQTVALLNHPNIVTLHEFEETPDYYYLILELLDGTTLADILKTRSPMELEDALSITYQIGAALEWAHKSGVIHRDIKPENVMLLPSGQVKVMDFGTARLGNSTLTREGDVVGTIEYMSPEQTEGKPADGRSDLFSLAIILYEMLTGRNPFEATTPAGTIFKIIHTTPLPPSELNARLPPELSAVVLKALEKEPSDRYERIVDFRHRLRRATGIRETTARPLHFRRFRPSLWDNWVSTSLARSSPRLFTAAAGGLVAWGLANWPPYPSEAAFFIAAAVLALAAIRPLWGLLLIGLVALVPLAYHNLALGLVYLLVAGFITFGFRRQASAAVMALLTPFLATIHIGLLLPFLTAFFFSPLAAGAAAALGALIAEVWILSSPVASANLLPLAPPEQLWISLNHSGPSSTVALIVTAFVRNPSLIYQPILWFLVASGASFLLNKEKQAWQVAGVAATAIGLFIGYSLLPFADVKMDILLKTLSVSFIIGLFLVPLAPLRPLEPLEEEWDSPEIEYDAQIVGR